MKNLTLLVTHDATHRLEEYVRFYCEKLLETPCEVLLILNGKFDEESKQFLKTNKIPYIERENRGYDFGAWKDGLHFIGREKISQFDNLLLLNDSVFGPFFSLKEIIEKMSAETIDFWGITKHPKMSPNVKYEHLQTYFICFKKRILNSNIFYDYWKNLKEPATFNKAVQIEIFLTNFFYTKGFSYKSYINEDIILKKETPNITIFSALDTIKYGSPFVKKKIFTSDFNILKEYGAVNIPNDIVNFILLNTDYPTELIKRYLIRVLPPSQYKNLFSLNFIGENHCCHRKWRSHEKKVALIFYVYFEELLDKCCNYINSFEKKDKIVIVSPKKELLNLYKKELEDRYPEFEVRTQENRGRNEAAYFITCRDILKEYDYVCLCHDKKLTHLPQLIGEVAFDHCLKNCLGSPQQVNSIINILEQNVDIGMLTPPIFHISVWKDLNLIPYGRNEKECKLFLKINFPDIPFDKNPLSPYGSVFWVRKGALTSLLKLNLKLTDLPAEPLPVDGTFLHTLERLYPSFVQASNFATGWIFNKNFVSQYIEAESSYITKNAELLKWNVFLLKKAKASISKNKLIWSFLRKIKYLVNRI